MKAPNILVVDDEPVIRDILKEFLEFEDYRVTLASEGGEALRILNRGGFDLLLTDLKMSPMDGLELIKRVRENEYDISVVMMTGYGTVETAIDAMKHGAFDYVLKPFKPEEVVRVITKALHRRQLERENVALREMVGYYELSEAMASSMPLNEQLELVVKTVREAIGAERVSIVTHRSDAPGFKLCAGDAEERLNFGALTQKFLTDPAVRVSGTDAKQWFIENDGDDTSLLSVPLRVRGAPLGILTAIGSRSGQSFSEGQRKGLSIIGGRAAQAIDNARLFATQQQSFTETIEGFARALEEKDAYTHGHSDRVAEYSRLIAVAMGLPQPEVDQIRHGGLMHDIGKLGIVVAELNKPRKLTEAEFSAFRSHPVRGARIIEPISFLSYIVPCVYFHHESWNGRGYPEGRSDEAIPLEARILAVADSYDAMTSDRPYRKALPHEVAMAEFRRCSGKQFDPTIVDAFSDAISDFRRDRESQGLPNLH